MVNRLLSWNLKGGLLSSKTSPIAEILKKANPEASIASWAIRFAASLDGVAVVLSGMSNMDQILDNINTVNNLEPLSDEELSVVLEVVDVLNKIPRVPCTECGYCLTSCPQNIYISKLIGLYNDYLVHNTIENTAAMYRFFTDNVRNASICVSCYSCEKHCPQHIEIADTMAKISAVLIKNEIMIPELFV